MIRKEKFKGIQQAMRSGTHLVSGGINPEGLPFFEAMIGYYFSPESKGFVLFYHSGVVDMVGGFDTIVNAANKECLGGGGVDGVISDWGGESLLLARQSLPVDDKGYRCLPGNSVVTVPGDFPTVKRIIHAVAPNFQEYENEEEALEILGKTYDSIFEKGRTEGSVSYGIPALAAGFYRGSCPLKKILETGVRKLMQEAGSTGSIKIDFCVYTQEEADVLKEILEEMK